MSQSNVVPFEVVEESAFSDEGVRIEVYDRLDPFRLIDVVPRRAGVRYLEEFHGDGGGSFTIAADDLVLQRSPELLAKRNVVKVRLGGRVVGVWLITKLEEDVVAEIPVVKVSGPGARRWLTDALVYPMEMQPWQTKRGFTFASPAGPWLVPSEWSAVVAQCPQDKAEWHPAEGDPLPLDAPRWVGAPAEWPDPDAWWIWDRDSLTSPAPVGYVYFRREFTVADVVTVDVWVTADDAFTLYVDGVPQLEGWVSKSWTEKFHGQVTLVPGSHVIGVRGKQSWAENAGLLVSVTDPDGVVLLRSDGSWVCQGYADPPPGWTPGEILQALFAEAAARGVTSFGWLGLSATGANDSSGAVWDSKVDWQFDVGVSLREVVDRMEELQVDVRVDPESLLVDVFVDQGVDRSVQVGESQPVEIRPAWNAVEASVSTDADVKNVLLVVHESAVTEVVDASGTDAEYGRVEAFLNMAGQSAGRAADLAEVTLERFRSEREAMTVRLVPVPDHVPWVDFGVGDWIRVPARGGGWQRVRVKSLALDEDDAGNPQFTIEVSTIDEDREVRLQRWLQRRDYGSLGGQVANATPVGERTELTGLLSRGPAGRQGEQGPVGAVGPRGAGVLSGSGAPGVDDGEVGDWWVDVGTYRLWGPKEEGGWGSPASLVGPTGVGLPTGGAANQVLMKRSGSDFDFRWADVPGPARRSSVVSVGTVAAGAAADFVFTAAATFGVLRVQVGASNMRVRLYASAAFRTADAERAVGTDPTGEHGLLLELVTTDSVTGMWLAPMAYGYTTAGDGVVYGRVDNVGTSPVTCSLTVTWFPMEV